MSILLDALKKSEERRRLGKAPDIHSPVSEGSERRAAVQPWIPVTLIAICVIAMAWFGWRQFQPPGDAEQSPSEAAPVAMEPSASASGAAATATGLPEPASGSGSAAPAASIPRTPVETLPREPGSDAAAGSAAPVRGAASRKSRVNQSFTAFEAAQQAAVDSQDAQAAAAGADSVAAAAAQQPPAQPPAAPVAQVEATTQAATAEPTDSRTTEPISYWELPQGIRDGLPDLRITVLVFAERPQDRFVLVGGQRLVEKDQYQEGLVLEEIRREGAVFLYRNYRFLVEG